MATNIPNFNEKIGIINIVPFVPENNGMKSLSYEKLPDFTDDPTAILDELWEVSLSVRSRRPAWFGMMQMVHAGDHPASHLYCFCQ